MSRDDRILHEEQSADFRRLSNPPSSEEVGIILKKLERLEKLMVVSNRAFPTWASLVLSVMTFAHVATLVTLIYIVQRLPPQLPPLPSFP